MNLLQEPTHSSPFLASLPSHVSHRTSDFSIRRSYSFLLISIFLLLSFCGCPAKMEDPCLTCPETPPRNPREYQWTFDTLKYNNSPQMILVAIRGSSSSNIYAAGHNSEGEGYFWHYDGKTWSDINLVPLVGGGVDILGVLPFADDNVWAVGGKIFSLNPFVDSSLILHFDGHSWKRNFLPSGRMLLDIDARNPSNIWVAGAGLTLGHFDGEKWGIENLPISPKIGFESSVGSIAVSPTGIVSANVVFVGLDIGWWYYFFQKKNNTWSRIDSAFLDVYGNNTTIGWGERNIWNSPTGVLFSVGTASIFRRGGEAWTSIYHDPNQVFDDIYGTADNSIFVCGSNGSVLHFDGTSFFEFQAPLSPMTHFKSIWCNDREVFAVGTIGNQTIIAHGK